VVEVRDGKGGSRIAVARLANRAGIQEIAARRFNSQCRKGFGWARMNLENFKPRILIRKAALVMRVTEEGDFGGGIQEPVERLRGREDVFILILKRAMNEYDAVGGEGTSAPV